MLRWICEVKLTQPHSTAELRSKMEIPNIENVLRCNRLRLFGHRCCQDDSLWTKKIMSFVVDGPTPKGRPRLRWNDVINKDLKICNLKPDMASNRMECRTAITPVMQLTYMSPTHLSVEKE